MDKRGDFMGLFDVFKIKNNEKVATSRKETELTIAVRELFRNDSYENQKKVAEILYQISESKTWVYMPIHQNSGGGCLEICKHNNHFYAAMLSGDTEFKKGVEFDIAKTDVNKLFDAVFANKDIVGIVINPYTQPVYIHKGFLLKCLLHEKYPKFHIYSPAPKNWGTGIPPYDECDLMTQAEINSFACNTLVKHEIFTQNGDTVVSTCDYPGAIPNLIMQLNGQDTFILVKGYLGENEPSITAEERTHLLMLAKKFNAQCYFAAVGFFSVDNERGKQNLALKGDAFYNKISKFDKLD